MTGSTTTSMMAVALNRISRSADATGPCGSSTPARRHEATRQAADRTAKIAKREDIGSFMLSLRDRILSRDSTTAVDAHRRQLQCQAAGKRLQSSVGRALQDGIG